MKVNQIKYWALLIIVMLTNPKSYSIEFAMHNKTGNYLSEEIMLYNEDSVLVSLTDQINKVTILSLVYYDCQQYCPKLLKGTNKLINDLPLNLGREYQVFTISYYENDLPWESRKLKSQFLPFLTENESDAKGWQFFTADQSNISKLTENLGYGYFKDNDHYMHTTMLVVISPKGKIINYMYGTKFLPLDFEVTYQKALNEEERNTVPRDLKYCSNYIAPAHKKLHKMAVIFGSVILISAFSLFIFLSFYKNKNLVS